MNYYKIFSIAVGLWSVVFVVWQLWDKLFLEPNLLIRIIETFICCVASVGLLKALIDEFI